MAILASMWLIISNIAYNIANNMEPVPSSIVSMPLSKIYMFMSMERMLLFCINSMNTIITYSISLCLPLPMSFLSCTTISCQILSAGTKRWIGKRRRKKIIKINHNHLKLNITLHLVPACLVSRLGLLYKQPLKVFLFLLF